MKRTTISLPDDLAAALEHEASRLHTSVSQVARDALEAKLRWGKPRELAFIGIVDGTGPETTYAEHLDEYLAEQWATEIEHDALAGDR
jgi:metal-responsive CopG/Arc/MetJ family transcriptional regulator